MGPSRWRVGWLVAAVLVTSFAAWPSPIDPMQLRNAVFIILGLFGIVWLIPNWWLRAFLAWAVVSFVWSGARVWGMAGLLGLLAWAVFYREAMDLTDKTWRLICWVVVVVCAAQGVWMGLQALDLDPYFRAVTWRGELQFVHATRDPVSCTLGDQHCLQVVREFGYQPAPVPVSGWFLNPMDGALFLGLAAPMLAAIHPALVLLAALPIIVWLRATVGVVALAVLAVWLGRRWWPVVLPATVAAMLGLAWRLDPQGVGLKSTLWQTTLFLIDQRPWTGWGPNAVTYAVFPFQPQNNLLWNFLFNEWLQGALEFGLPALTFAAGYVMTLACRGWRCRFRLGELAPALLILVAVSTFSIPFRIGPVALLSALYLGRFDGIVRSSA